MSGNTVSWTEIRRAAADPLSTALKGLINKQNMFINAQEQQTQQRARGIGRSTSSRLTYQDPFSYGFASDFKNRFFVPPFEPDGKYLTCWIPMKSLGRYLKDLSFHNNHAYVHGLPNMCSGPDDGLFGGRIAIEFNAGSRNNYMYIPHSPTIDTGAVVTGISIFIRLKFNSLESSGIDTTVFQKIDTEEATSGFALRAGQDGRLKWYPRRASVTYDHITYPGVVETNTIYDIGCKYTLSGNATELYVNGSGKTDTGSDPITFPVGDGTPLRIGMGDDGDLGRAQMTCYDFRVYYEYMVSAGEWGNLYLNKRSISSIQYGLVAAEGITQLEFTPPFTDGFTDGFTH